MSRLVCWGLGLSLLLVTPGLAQQQDLTRDQVAAYVALTKADRARDRGESGAAIAAYEEALAKYVSIKKQDPRWHPDIVQYRMAYCANELEKLRKPAAPPPVTAVAPVVPVAPESLASLVPAPPAQPAAPGLAEVERAALQARIAELETALQVTQALARVEAERLAVQAERDALQARVTQLERAPAPEPVVIPPDTQALARVQLELERVTGEWAALQKRVTEVSEERDATAESARQVEAELGQKLKASEQAQARQAKEVERLQEALKEARAEVGRVEEKATQQVLAAQAKAESKLGPLQVESSELKLALTALQEELAQAREAARVAQATAQAAQQEQAMAQQTLAQVQAAQVDPQELARLKELADTRLRAYEAAERERDQQIAQQAEMRRSLEATQTALESALADKMALESRLPASSAEPAAPAPVEAKQAANLKALQETLDRQEKEMSRVREYKKQVTELEKQLRACEKKAGQAADPGVVDQLNGQIKSLTRQMQAARDEAARREETLRAMEQEAAARPPAD